MRLTIGWPSIFNFNSIGYRPHRIESEDLGFGGSDQSDLIGSHMNRKFAFTASKTGALEFIAGCETTQKALLSKQ